MKIISLLLIILIVHQTSYCQNLNRYTITGIPHLDCMGNLFQIVKNYDHIATSEDSALFYSTENLEILKLMDSVYAQKRKSIALNKKQNINTVKRKKIPKTINH
jgi:hypothetical protein